MTIEELQPADTPELSRFLAGGFAVAPDADFFSPEALRWKYFEAPAVSATPSPISLIARVNGTIVGHVGLCPRSFVVGGNSPGIVTAAHPIDWLGSPEYPAVGAVLMLRAFDVSRTQYVIGGSSMAQPALLRFGFERLPSVGVYRKVLSPFYRFRIPGRGLLRQCAGTAKDVLAYWRRPPEPPTRLDARPVRAFGAEIDALFASCPQPVVTCRRDHALLNYFLRYPQGNLAGWTLNARDRLVGCALTRVKQHGRVHSGQIAECWLGTDDPAHWRSAVAVLTERMRARGADYVTCYASVPWLRDALAWNGYRLTKESNAYLRDRTREVPRDRPFYLTKLEGDHAIL